MDPSTLAVIVTLAVTVLVTFVIERVAHKGG